MVAVLETVKLVKNPVIAVRIEEKRLDEVALENVASVDARVVIVAEAEVSDAIVPVAVLRSEIDPEAEVRSEIVAFVIVVVASDTVPVA